MKVCSKFCALLEVVEVHSQTWLDFCWCCATQGNIDIVDIMKKTRSFLFLYHTKHHAGIIMDNVTW